MKRLQLIGIGFSLICLWIILSSNSNGRATGANSGNTGAPNETTTCSNCHSGGSYGTVTLTIQLFSAGTTNAVTSYVAGTLYDLRVTVNHTSGTPVGYGFQLTTFRQSPSTPLGDTYSNLASNVKKKTITSGTYNGRTYCEHNGVTSNNVFNMSWTAPAAGTGTVVFYAAGNAVNGNNSDSQDKAGNSSLTVTEQQALSVSGTVTNVNCNGGSNGAVNITPAGGSPTYTFHWSNNATTEDVSNLTAGTYTVTITDASSSTATASYTVTQPNVLTLNATPGTILCNGGTASVTLSAGGGTPTYSYSGTTTNLSAGTYNYTVTDSKGCTANTSVTISQPAALQAGTNSSLVANCFGGTASIVVSATGGTAPYSGTGAFSAAAGPHTYTVTDANNCSTQLSITVTQPTQLSASATNDTIPCNGGSATVIVTAAGGTAPYSGTGTFNPATPGTYTYTITDAHNCATNATAVISADNGFSANAAVADAQCFGLCNGTINVTLTGGTAPFTYSWSDGTTTKDHANTCAGNYTQTITDNGGCTFTNNYVVSEPADLVVQATPGSIDVCFGDSALVTLNISGGVAPYTYPSPLYLPAGFNQPIVTDANGCWKATSVTVNEAPQILVSSTVNASTGFDGQIQATVSGGQPPYFFNWSDGGGGATDPNLTPGYYSLTVTDNMGCSVNVDSIFVPFINGIEDVLAAGVRLYPNPAENNLMVSFDKTITEGTLTIRTLDGREAYTTNIRNQKDISLSLTDIPQGLYLLQIKTDKGIYSRRFVKQ